MRSLVAVALAAGGPQSSVPPATPAPSAESQVLAGGWEGPRKRVRIGQCPTPTSGPRDAKVTISLEPDGSLRGVLRGASGAPGEMDWKGRVEGTRGVFDVPRLATCGPEHRKYTITLEAPLPVAGDGGRVLELEGVDPVCPALFCRFRDEYELRWTGPVPTDGRVMPDGGNP